MCRKINLRRISPVKLSEHARNAWLKSHNYMINNDAIEEILNLTECHTNYLNHLCLRHISTGATINTEIVINIWGTLRTP